MEGLIATLLMLGILAYKIGPPILRAMEEQKAAKADAELLHNKPEVWKAKEEVKLQREALEANKQLAAAESRRRNAGTVAGIARTFWPW